MKRLTCLALCLCLFPFSALGEENAQTVVEEGLRPEFVEALLDAARGELGYAEGTGGYTKYGEWAGDPCAEWCAEFVCWCVEQAQNRTGQELLNTIYPNYSGQNTGRDWFLARGRFVYRKGVCPGGGVQWVRNADHALERNEFIPRSGDLVFFSYNEAGDTEHVALVEYCSRDAEGRVTLHVIEGNNPDRVQRNAYPLEQSQVLGFGLCEDLVDTTLRLGGSGEKVLLFQQKLFELGRLEEKHLTGTFGTYTRIAVVELQQELLPGRPVNGLADRETQQLVDRLLEKQRYDDPDNWLVED